MTLSNPSICLRLPWLGAGVLLLSVLAGCAQKPAPSGVNDPREAQNREVHEFNKAVDQAILKPLSSGGDLLPAPLRTGITNAAANLGTPGDVVNDLLQGRPDRALENTARFVLNTTLGIGGLFDPAMALGVEGRPTDFGETLHVWGAEEGTYIEFPLLGPTTERDLVGKAVDAAMNPWRFVLPVPERNAVTGLRFAGSILDRGTYSETVDSLLYGSADSYAQARLLYLQSRRYQLGQASDGAAEDDFIDPYEDPYGN